MINIISSPQIIFSEPSWTTDQSKFMSVMAKIEADGECRFTAAVRVAQLSVENFATNYFFK